MGHVRKNNGIGRIPTPPQIQVREGKLSAQDLQVLYNAVMALYPLINGGITFGNGDSFSYSGNLDGEWVPWVTPAVADTEFEIPHGLDRIPLGYLVFGQDKYCKVKDSRRGSWTSDRLLLKCDTAAVSLLLWIT